MITTSVHTAYRPEVDVRHIDEKKLVRKIDLWTIPWLSFLYLLSFLDRTSIGKYLYGLEDDLHITDTQYLLCLTVFFFSYAVFEVPSNTIQGLVHNYGGLLVTRFMLGMMEAGLFPGVTYYISCWYKRDEYGIRAAMFFSAATVSGAFGGLLAAAIKNMDGVGGKPGWAWIFILEGLATVLAGTASFWMIQDFPDTAKFLTPEERVAVIRRLQNDDQFSAAGESFKIRYIWMSIRDWKTWIGMIVYAGSDMPLYAFALFLPSYDATPANLLSVPVYVFACIVTCFVGFAADRLGKRGYFNLSAALSYFAVYLAAGWRNIPSHLAWVSNNVEGSYKRSVSLAMVISFGSLNGAVSSNVYRARDEPWYPLGHGLVLMYIALGIISSIVMIVLLKRENAKRERGERDEIIANSQTSIADIQSKNRVYSSVEEAKRNKGDKWSGYRYTI
ncbi:MFS general substrate transporter [Fistulina hepatica ATCC 64428]|uniref:MFS general substrate transporter n=1 Tax=Fistulina hepatica ATCC 64428 TaxID=1128425 RepID=A0A0D7AEX5_9AGAR|nr:MFS general substrate transporter [Fistulina hepatica ATCC 64428]